MKEILKPIFTTLLSFFNVGIFQLSDKTDSLEVEFLRTNVEIQAVNMAGLYLQVLDYQQIMILIEVVQLLLMILPLVLMLLFNLNKIFYYWDKTKEKAKQVRSSFSGYFNRNWTTFKLYFKNLLNP